MRCGLHYANGATQAKESVMTQHKNIYEALTAAQGEFGKVTKGATNPAFKSRYADLSDVASVVIPVMNAHGCAVLHYMVTADGEKAMRTEFVHAATETRVACDVPLIVDKNNMQGMKSATTYAKRIGLESLSGIAPEDDDGNAAAKSPPQAPAVISDADCALIIQLIEATATDARKFCQAFKIASVKELPVAAFPKAKAMLEKKLADAAKAADNSLADDAAFLGEGA
jgi:hypothetical protein